MTVLTLDHFNCLMASFEPFESPPLLAVATSGGADSLALTLVAHQWATSKGGQAIALTVDHKLRPESSTEADQVKTWLTAKGVEHHTLEWHHDGIVKSALQATARQARYRLLGEWCQTYGVKHLLTAHHAQDQLETFMIRLAKGSGLKGLTGMQAAVPTEYGRLLRPLLTVDPQDLKDTLQELDQPFIQDPSNENTDFTRIRWRQLLPTLAKEGLAPHTLHETLDRFNHSQRLIEHFLKGLSERMLTFSPHGYAIVTREVLQESEDIQEEILRRTLHTIGPQPYPIRRHSILELLKSLKEGNNATLSGCQIQMKEKDIWIVREPRAANESIEIQEKGTYRWDQRFEVDVRKAPCTLAALGEEGINQLDKEVREHLKLPYLVLQTLPALWKGKTLLKTLPPYQFISSKET